MSERPAESEQIIGFTLILPEGASWAPPPTFKSAMNDIEAMAKRYGLELHAITEGPSRATVLSGHAFEILGEALTVPREWQ
jgi:hypothetical protein